MCCKKHEFKCLPGTEGIYIFCETGHMKKTCTKERDKIEEGKIVAYNNNDKEPQKNDTFYDILSWKDQE